MRGCQIDPTLVDLVEHQVVVPMGEGNKVHPTLVVLGGAVGRIKTIGQTLVVHRTHQAEPAQVIVGWHQVVSRLVALRVAPGRLKTSGPWGGTGWTQD